MNRRAFIQSAAATAVLAACGNPADLAASPGHDDFLSVRMASTSRPNQTVYRIPNTIRSDGSREVSRDINDWIASIPNGTAGAYNTAAFATNGIYWVDDTIEPQSKSYIAFDGNGSTFVRRNQLPDTASVMRSASTLAVRPVQLVRLLQPPRLRSSGPDGRLQLSVGGTARVHPHIVGAVGLQQLHGEESGATCSTSLATVRFCRPLITTSSLSSPVRFTVNRYQSQLATTSRSVAVTSGRVGAAGSTSNRTATTGKQRTFCSPTARGCRPG